MNERSFSILDLARMHSDFAPKCRRRRAVEKHRTAPLPPERGEKPAEDAPQGELFGKEALD